MSTTTTPHTQTAYKDTPIGKIPADWEVKKLGELGEVVTGLTYSPSQVRDTGLLVLRSSNVQDRVLVYNDNVYVDERDLKYNPVKKGDILICVRNGSRALIGKNARVDYKAEGLAFGAFMAIFRSVLNDYLFHFFDTDLYYKQIHVNLGATINSINNNDLRDFKIPLPPLPEQKRIAEVLSTWDKAIQLTEQLIRQKEQRKKWLMQNLLTGKMRLKGFSGEWKECKLGDLFERVTRKNSEGNKNVVTISAQRGFVKQTDFFNKSVASEVLDNYYLVYNGEFCYNKSYSNGYPWGATKRLNNFDKAVVTTLYICFCIKDNTTTNSDFFEQYFEANLLDKGLTQIAHEGGRAHGLLNVTPSDFFSLKVKMPDFKQQTAIAEVLQTADKEIELLKAKAEQLKEQKKGLMQQLLTGKKRLNLNLQD